MLLGLLVFLGAVLNLNAIYNSQRAFHRETLGHSFPFAFSSQQHHHRHHQQQHHHHFPRPKQGINGTVEFVLFLLLLSVRYSACALATEQLTATTATRRRPPPGFTVSANSGRTATKRAAAQPVHATATAISHTSKRKVRTVQSVSNNSNVVVIVSSSIVL